MSIPNRHAGAPFLGGEYLTGPNLENDIEQLFTILGKTGNTRGQLEGVNVSPSAAIEGSKLLDASISTIKIRDNSIDGESITDAVLTTAKVPDGGLAGLALAVGSVWNATQGYNGTQFSTDGTWQDAATVSLTTSPESSTVILLGTVDFKWETNGDELQLKFVRDTTDLRQFDNMTAQQLDQFASVTVPWLDTGHSASTSYTWKLQAQQTSGSGGYVIHQAHIAVLELRR